MYNNLITIRIWDIFFFFFYLEISDKGRLHDDFLPATSRSTAAGLLVSLYVR